VGWADSYIERLKEGETVKFRPRGNSMHPLIKSGQLVTVEPLSDIKEVSIGDIVLCNVRGRQYLHLVKSVQDRRMQICNNRGHTNGWTHISKVYGQVVKVE
jgi:SOS-response transcriptional repressor LexA